MTAGNSPYRAVALLLQQSGHISPDGHLLGQLLVLHADPPPQLLQEAQEARPALGARLQMGSAKHATTTSIFILHLFVDCFLFSPVSVLAGRNYLLIISLSLSFYKRTLWLTACIQEWLFFPIFSQSFSS